MALRDQPYIPLYIQDFLTDEKLIECSAAATGVYVRLMCIMHKSDEYGKILLKQKDKQTGKQINNFACKVAKQMPYTLDVIITSLIELISENVLYIDGDSLCQKRMIKDNQLSLKRSESGKLGGIKHAENIQNFARAKVVANTEYENEDINVLEEIGSEKIKTIANEVWLDRSWRESLCMGLSINMEELKKWLALFNSSISNEKIENFDKGRYKKMSRGWISTQQAKGVKVETGISKKSDSAPLTKLNHGI